jgi:hypothetical protein
VSFQPRQKFRVTFTADGVGAVTALLGDTPADIPSGYGGWVVVSRQRKIGLTVWQGKDPLRMAVSILFDGFIDGTSQEIPISRLSRMALPPAGGGEPPVVKVSGLGVPKPGPTEWVIESLAWGTNVIWENAANGVLARLRQDCVVSLLQYVDDDRVAFKGLQPASSPTGKSKSGWPKTYTAKAGDTLNTIAKHFYGDASKWKKIGDANGIRDPRSVKKNQKLRIPAP